MKRQSGFTLIETLVTGLVSTLLAGVVLSLLQLSNTQLLEGSAGLRLSRLYNATSSEIQRVGRRAYVVKTTGDILTGLPSDTLSAAAMTGLSNVMFCDTLGDSLGGYKVLGDGRLQEWVKSGRTWKDLAFGPDTVRVDSARSTFDILPRRRGISFTLRLKSAAGDTIPPVREMLVCRNANR